MTTTIGESVQRKCEALKPKQADALFFPTAGGKPNKAKVYCSDCPFKSQCLKDAIEKKLVGYFAGTTDDDRRLMAPLHGIKPTGLPMPPEPPSRRIFRKIVVPEDAHSWLDQDIEPSPQDLVA